ncbi:hypothetical protein QBC35DRAFT_236572 [Podospora australis]|uniref:Uncharacterized protein n=1 Tax=Podospora australis TaxID=1536484 RepID=A0AAN6WVN0_9PEZI|nr:hypothetical protein QBC35DRAFT_236572 [Podospora australis]
MATESSFFPFLQVCSAWEDVKCIITHRPCLTIQAFVRKQTAGHQTTVRGPTHRASRDTLRVGNWSRFRSCEHHQNTPVSDRRESSEINHIMVPVSGNLTVTELLIRPAYDKWSFIALRANAVLPSHLLPRMTIFKNKKIQFSRANISWFLRFADTVTPYQGTPHFTAEMRGRKKNTYRYPVQLHPATLLKTCIFSRLSGLVFT